jgi:chromosomal replication initiation ATPase DnaA
VALGLSMRDIAPVFNRDRTTVVYACHMIEDMRDDRDFDRVIVMVERVALAAFGNREVA